MISSLMTLARSIRARIMRFLKPKHAYFFAPQPVRDLAPLSSNHGFDRGTPINRYYIENFLEQHKHLIRGRCLEIHDDAYTKRFGGTRVTESHVLDIDTKNKSAHIHADLRSMPIVPDNTYDCIILTQTLGMIDDVESAVRECHRVLKPGGWIIATSSALTSMLDNSTHYWRFTTQSLHYLFGKHFKQESLSTASFGNVLAGQHVWVGLSREELEPGELDYHDPRFAVIVGIIAQK